MREFGLGFGATFSVTLPFPVPEARETTVMAVGSLFAIVQSQPAPTITLNWTGPPVLGTIELPGLKEL